LWGGANALNSAEDRDTGPVNLLPDPPPLPAGLWLFGLVTSALAVAVAGTRGRRPALGGARGVGAAFCYFVPRPLKRAPRQGGPGLDCLASGAGGGLGAVLLGYVATPAPLDSEVFLVGLAFTVCIWGGIPTSQIFQLSPGDNVSTARNYTSWLGPRLVLRLGPVFFLAHLALLIAHALLWRPGLFAHLIPATLWLAWAALVLLAAAHSFAWSAAPFERSHERMLRQLALLMTSQVCWTAAVWLARQSRDLS